MAVESPPRPQTTTTPTTDAAHLARAILPALQDRQAEFLRDLEAVVNMEAGTYDRDDVMAVGAWVRARCAGWHATYETHPGGQYADSFALTLRGAGAGTIVLLAHLDTVFPHGTAAARPFRIAGERALGPGTCDMKAGLLAGIYAVEALQQAGFDRFGQLRLVCTGDEEVGSPSSKPFIERMAAGATAVFVLEAARENGDIVGQRRGGGFFRLEVRGRSAHAGVEPQKGRSAALTLSRQVVALHALTDLACGRTVNVGTMQAGIRPNVVPDHAVAEVDLRANTIRDMRDLLAGAVAALEREALEGTSYTWAEVQFRPPWGPNRGTERLAMRARSLAQALGFVVRAVSTGGMSDGNITAGCGVPTLDGLGPIGGLDHGPDEYVDIPSIAPRTALLAGLIAAAATSGPAAVPRKRNGSLNGHTVANLNGSNGHKGSKPGHRTTRRAPVPV
jgi:glutamate carboxypeptidase